MSNLIHLFCLGIILFLAVLFALWIKKPIRSYRLRKKIETFTNENMIRKNEYELLIKKGIKGKKFRVSFQSHLNRHNGKPIELFNSYSWGVFPYGSSEGLIKKYTYDQITFISQNIETYEYNFLNEFKNILEKDESRLERMQKELSNLKNELESRGDQFFFQNLTVKEKAEQEANYQRYLELKNLIQLKESQVRRLSYDTEHLKKLLTPLIVLED